MGVSGAAVALETYGAQLLSLLLLPAVQCSLQLSERGWFLAAWCAGLPAAARMLTSMLCAALHRRHLMIWAVFAPKLLFEASASVLVSLVLAAQRLTLAQ